jgi:heptosyltransferase-2
MKIFNKILIIQTAYLGDLIWTTPLMKTISQIAINRKVDVLSLPSTKPVINGLPFISEVITHDKRNRLRGFHHILKTANHLSEMNYDLIISPHLSLRTSLFSFLSRAEYRCGFKEAKLSKLYNIKAHYDKNLHFVDRFLNLAKSLGVEEISRELIVYYDKKSALVANNLLDDSRDFIGFIPGSRWHTKIYPPEYYKKLAILINKQLDLDVVIFGTPDEKRLGEIILEKTDKSNKNLCGNTDLNVLASSLKKAKAVIGSDCGGMHIAEAVYTPAIFLYGSTTPEMGIGPIQGNYRVIKSEMKCSPCSEHGFKKCPQGFDCCMIDIKPEKVFNILIKLME